MARPLLVLAQPTAFAGLSPRVARLIALLVAVFVLTSFSAPTSSDLVGPLPASGQTDVDLYSGIIEGVRHGGDYYSVAADALRNGGYPLRPFVAFRLPTLAVVSASVPRAALSALLWALALGTAIAWWARLAPVLGHWTGRVASLVLLVGGVAGAMLPSAVLFHEAWAGLFIALSLVRWRPGHATEAMALGLAAALIRETAALYLAIMFLAAWHDGRRREMLGWLAATTVLATVVVAHAWATTQVTRPLDLYSPGWTGLLGFGFAVRTIVGFTALLAVPPWLAAPLVPLSIAGWAAWRSPLGRRVFATLLVYTLLMALGARPDNFYWVLLMTPLPLAGLVFLPDGVRDLARAALDRRRIVVRRVAR